MSKKLVECKSCGETIAKNAKTCPHCGAKRKKPVLGVILLVLGICIIIGVLAGGSDEPKKVNETPEASTETSTEAAPTSQTTFGVGDAVELNDVKVTLTNISESNGSDFNRPSDGNVFLLCEFEIENNSNKEVAVSSMMSFDAYCDDYTCNYSLSALLEKGDKNQLDGTIASGKKFAGVVGYEVPADWSEFEIRFTPDFWGKDITFVASH